MCLTRGNGCANFGNGSRVIPSASLFRQVVSLMSINTGSGAGFPRSLFIITLLAVAGCSSSQARLEAPSLSPSSVASQAMAEYDTNHDGSIDAAELDKALSLKSSLALLDKNGDQKISADEIAARVQAWKDSAVAVIPCVCVVTFDGKPLAGATVTFVPEKFLGPGFKPAIGTTTSEGIASMSAEGLERNGVKLAGVYCGFYKITLSKTDGGKEVVPDRYNTQSELGLEVGPDVPALQSALKFDIKK